ncbi:hypothetical protein N7462_001912 [Penicillium macrosclerotiorum]|uniref:uncharacterized protein n=1 Tax=Penicillium macrosclerotiorum TaxID=303699 RepID=UPI002546D029|nr:uncharacterized protein N7462_001912 [Penicillium macrosclerotiorum]KAJ5692489.1 hypothetical protein N7462_001912 [Penicillium macrosclerotiorum]
MAGSRPFRFMALDPRLLDLTPPPIAPPPTLRSPQANLPNLRRLFVEARTEVEENEYSRTAFYNLVLFISSVAVFSLAAQRMSGQKTAR